MAILHEDMKVEARTVSLSEQFHAVAPLALTAAKFHARGVELVRIGEDGAASSFTLSSDEMAGLLVACQDYRADLALYQGAERQRVASDLEQAQALVASAPEGTWTLEQVNAQWWLYRQTGDDHPHFVRCTIRRQDSVLFMVKTGLFSRNAYTPESEEEKHQLEQELADD